MDQPQLRFCTSADGTRIPYATYGEGPRMFYVPATLSVDSALTIPESRAFLDALASRMTLATCDLSYTDLNIGAVTDSLGWNDFVLFATNDIMLNAAGFIGSHPQRVTRLIWWNTVYARMVGSGPTGEYASVVRAGGEEFSHFRRQVVGGYFPDGPVRLAA